MSRVVRKCSLAVDHLLSMWEALHSVPAAKAEGKREGGGGGGGRRRGVGRRGGGGRGQGKRGKRRGREEEEGGEEEEEEQKGWDVGSGGGFPCVQRPLGTV